MNKLLITLFMLFSLILIVGCQERPLNDPNMPVEETIANGQNDTIVVEDIPSSPDDASDDTQVKNQTEVTPKPEVSDDNIEINGVGKTFEIREDIKVTVVGVEEQDRLLAKNFIGNLYNLTPQAGPNFKYVIVETVYTGPKTGYSMLDFSTNLFKNSFKLNTKESNKSYDMVCLNNVYNEPLISCSFTGASKLELADGKTYANKLVFVIPKNETVLRLSYFYSAQEYSSISLG